MNYSQRSAQSSVPRRGGSSLLNTIGFVGLGTMGRPMARNLVAAGHEFVVLCRNERHHAAAAEVGARAVDRVDELAEMDAVLSIVQDSPDVLGLALGENGLLARLRPGSLYDLSTIRPDAAREAGRAPLAWWSSRWAVKEFATTCLLYTSPSPRDRQ